MCVLRIMTYFFTLILFLVLLIVVDKTGLPVSRTIWSIPRNL